ncbi:MAG: phage portal protein [Planctomycetota bacterium]
MGRSTEQQLQSIYSGVGGAVRRIVDGVVGTFMPKMGLEMRQHRLRAQGLLTYEAARIGRTNSRSYSGSADAEAIPNLQILRDASRTMVRDDAHAAAAVRVLEENTVGKGILPQSICTPEATGMSEGECQDWRGACEAAWSEWAPHADATNYGSFSDLQRIGVRMLMQDGEGLGHLVKDGNDLFCELIDSDRLESPNAIDTDRMRAGVELGDRGQPVRYHFLDSHPADASFGARTGLTGSYVVAEENGYSMVQHVFRRDRPGQTRGVPWLAAALPYNRHLHEYLSSELIAARASSNIAMFVKRAPELDGGDFRPGSSPNDEGKLLQRLEAGTIEYLEEGESIEPFMPNRPGAQFDAFVTRILRAIWASQGLSYELVSKDLGRMNYSSARSMLLECRRGFDALRAMLIRQFCMPWWSNVIRSKISDGTLPMPPGFRDNPKPFLAVRWMPPAYGWVDPVKEIESSRIAIENHLSTPYDEAARLGLDAEELLRKNAEYIKKAEAIEEELGLKPGSLLGKGAASAPPATEPPDPPEEGDELDPQVGDEGELEDEGADDDENEEPEAEQA